MVYGRVYSIRSHQTTDIYIGSTTQILSKRMSDHRKDYKRYLNGQFAYVSSYKILQYEDAYIELEFEGEFESKYALMKKEGEYIREKECVNKNVAGRTDAEYRVDNKLQINKWREENKQYLLKYGKEYQEINREQILKKAKQTYECKCGSTCRIVDKTKHNRTQKHQKFIQSLSAEENSS
jgi:hypothetical protein